MGNGVGTKVQKWFSKCFEDIFFDSNPLSPGSDLSQLAALLSQHPHMGGHAGKQGFDGGQAQVQRNRERILEPRLEFLRFEYGFTVSGFARLKANNMA